MLFPKSIFTLILPKINVFLKIIKYLVSVEILCKTPI